MATYGKSFVGNTGGTGKHKDTVGSKVAKVAGYAIAQTIACTYHHNQHEDSPEDSECGEKGSHLILLEGTHYFLPTVEVKHVLCFLLSIQ